MCSMLQFLGHFIYALVLLCSFDGHAWTTGRSRSACRQVFVQAPVRLALLIAVPTVHVEEYTQHLLWSKRLVLLQVLVSVPLVVAVYSNDAFGNRSSDNVKSLSGIPDGMFMFLLPSPRDQHRREATTMAVLLPRGGLPTPISTLACSCMASTDQCTARF
eukprot:m.1342469 g.1342469  ORF g.1342469 m.1342469 type:complete len:160 (+) comp24898_c1_seq34:2177-2656(+)